MSANNIADENVVSYKLSRGIWYTGNVIEKLPADDFVVSAANLTVLPNGSVGMGPNVGSQIDLTTPTTTRNLPLHMPAINIPEQTSVTAPIGIVFDKFKYAQTGTSTVWFFNKEGVSPAVGSQTLGAGFNITGFVGYNNRLYCSTSNSSVYSITSYVPATPAATFTSIGASPSLDGIIYFKNRLFGFKGNTIYFTGIPVSGAYPETWNTAVNNIIVNATGFSPVIYKMMVFNDRILLFTNGGTFALVVQGLPSSWILKPIDLGVKVNSYDCAVEHKGWVYFVSYDGIGMTDGSTTRYISEPLNKLFKDAVPEQSQYRLYVIGSFLVLSVTMAYVDSIPRSYSTYNFYSHLDTLGAWTKPVFANDTPYAIMGTVGRVENYAGGYLQNSIILVNSSALGTKGSRIKVWYDKYYQTQCTISTGLIELGSELDVKFVKRGWLTFRGVPAGGTVSVDVFHADGTLIGTTVQSTAVVSGSQPGEILFKVGTKVKSIFVVITIENASFTVLDSINFIVGTERKNTETLEL